jgi:hypothetical protein
MLRKLVLGLALIGGAALPLAGVAEAAIGDGVAASHIATQLMPVEKAQFFFGGRNFCFYPDGWHGPGFYWCGYGNRNGLGYGGPVGWHGWRGGGGGHGGGGHGGGGHGGHGGGGHGGHGGGGHGGHGGGGHGGHGGGGHGGHGGGGHRH